MRIVAVDGQGSVFTGYFRTGQVGRSSDYLVVWDYNHDFLERRRALLEKRAREGRIRDGHGDLHAEHVWIGRTGVLAYDCIEFSDRIRQCDVAADIAFLYMDLLHHRRPDLAAALMEEYLRRTGYWEVRLLVPFYACYRAVVREKVESLQLADPGIAAPRKRAAARRATSYFRLARELARWDARPRLVLVGGLPGSGKSTISRALAERIGADCLACQLPHGKIENTGAFVDQCPPKGDQGIDAPDQDSCNEEL